MSAWSGAVITAALQVYGTGRVARAEAAVRLVVGGSGRDGWAVWFLGHLAFRQGRLADAAVLLAIALEIAPDNAIAHHDMGDTLRAQKRPEQAIACFETDCARPGLPAGLRRPRRDAAEPGPHGGRDALGQHFAGPVRRQGGGA